MDSTKDSTKDTTMDSTKDSTKDSTTVSISPPADPATAVKSVAFSKLFVFATPLDMFYIYFGCFCALLNGLVFPLFTIVFAGLLNAFSSPNFESTVATYSLYFLYDWCICLRLFSSRATYDRSREANAHCTF